MRRRLVQSTPQVLILVLTQLWKIEMRNGVQIQLRDDERIEVVLLGFVQVGHHVVNVKHYLLRVAYDCLFFQVFLSQVFYLVTVTERFNFLVFSFTSLDHFKFHHGMERVVVWLVHISQLCHYRLECSIKFMCESN